MVTTFCLRLAFGMIAPLMILPAGVVPPRFFRVQFLSILALLVLGGVFSFGLVGTEFWLVLGVACFFSLAGSIVWHTDEAPFGRILFSLTTFAVFALLIVYRQAWQSPKRIPLMLADDFASAAVLGGAMSAMLMGHSYLIAPAMSLSPLYRLLGFLAVALTIRTGLACLGLWTATRLETPILADTETQVWLAARWLLGLLAPIGLTWMAWETARIRSTQSATGILYVVTIVAFLGELLSLLLADKTGLIL